MVDFVESFMNPQLLVMLLAAAAAFATVLTVTMPLLSRDRMAVPPHTRGPSTHDAGRYARTEVPPHTRG